MDPTIRPPSNDDAAALADLCGQLGYPSTAAEVRDRMAALQGPDQVVLAAVSDSGQVVGWIHASVVRRLESDAYAEVGGMVVADGLRSRGVGAALLAAAEEWAGAIPIATMRVRCNVIRDRAHAFYDGAGYHRSKTAHVFVKRLQPEGPSP